MPSDGQSYVIFQRVGTLPVVASAFGSISTFYQRTKDSSSIVRFTLEKAETGVSAVAKTAAPVVNKLEKPICKLDDYACSKLDVIEEKYPIIKAAPNELISETYKAYGVVRKYGADKLGSFIPRVDPVLAYADKTVDYYMPAEESDIQEPKEKSDEIVKTKDRVAAISSKVRQRMFLRAMNQVKSVKKRSQDAVDRLTHTVNLIEYAKAFDGKVRHVWSEIQKDEETDKKEDEEKTEKKENETNTTSKVIEKRIIVTCRQIRRTVTWFSPTQFVPSSVYVPFEKTRKVTDDFVLSLLKTLRMDELPHKVIQNSKDGLVKVHENLSYVTDYVLHFIMIRKVRTEKKEPDEESSSKDSKKNC